ncbi:MAG TPA: acylphosphatase [Gammaproteobacteria bacterium]|nr:acylphosphatase [Gammaproteobacteria bacterium]
MKICRHYRVSGLVQGVFFRASTREKAAALGLTGWVRNLADGRVEAVACGEGPQLELLEQWLRRGPELAKVDSVQVTAEDYIPYTGFEIR